jgi:hypothetical protein
MKYYAMKELKSISGKRGNVNDNESKGRSKGLRNSVMMLPLLGTLAIGCGDTITNNYYYGSDAGVADAKVPDTIII